MTEIISRRVSEFSRHGGASNSWSRYQPSAGHASGMVCRYWLAGNCTRNPCRFLHPDKVKQSHNSLKPVKVVSKRTNEEQNLRKVAKRSSPENAIDNKGYQRGCTEKPSAGKKDVPVGEHRDCGVQKPSGNTNSRDPVKEQRKICEDWINQRCVYGGKCKFLHSWSSGNGLSKIAQLEGHQKAVTGIYLTSDSDKLFTSSKDGTVRLWNCHTGECVAVADMGAPVWCLASEGPWVFAGITNVIKAWNIKANVELTLDAPGGHIHSLTMVDGVLIGGLEDGSIFTWKMNSNAMSFEGPTVLKGHTSAVISLIWGAGRLYSSSMDNTIRVWDLEKMACINTLQKHSREATSLICWDEYLLSSSLDKTLKIWGCIKAGELEVLYNHIEEHGIVSLGGMEIAAGGSILLVSCSDKSVRLYDLPSFKERGCVFTKEEAGTMHVGPGGLFFTGDESGVVSVWKYTGDVSGSSDKAAGA